MPDAVRVEGATGLAKGLNRAGKDQDKAQAAFHRAIGRTERDQIRGAARAGTPRQSKMSGGIGSKADRRSVSITVKNTARAPGATPTFYGSKRSFGWYAGGGRPQNPPWVGNNWEVASRTGGPYVVNATLADRQPHIEASMLDESWRVVDRAVPARPKP